MGWRIKTWLNRRVEKIVAKHLASRKIRCSYQDDSSRTHDENRYIQVQTTFPNMDNVHYEYYCGHWALHFEPENTRDGYKYSRIIRYIQERVNNIPALRWETWGTTTSAKLLEPVDSDEKLENGLLFLSKTFDGLLAECATKFKPIDISSHYEQKEELCVLNETAEVSLLKMTLQDIFSYKLSIPSYQRIYCWSDKNIQTLWQDLKEIPENQTYHLGSIILQKNEDNCEIIDGQQRLVTITLILRALGYEGSMPLLLQRFMSQEACANIANAKYVIECLKGSDYAGNIKLMKKISENLVFSVLVLNSTNRDLAYTFFSNQNSKGVRLSDYDILKAHHLRFLIMNNNQAEHLARRWNNLSIECDVANESFVHKTLGLHLFRLRKWMRKNSCDDRLSSRPIKDEYSAAMLIPGIPPFGERFYFYEKIQGGSHFFAYAEHFVELYKQFVSTPHIYMLHKYLMGESHWKYESVIETILFAYYTKFGFQYLSEALFCIIGVVAQHRYNEIRALEYKINQYVQNSELIMMIDQASSPSFFLAESLSLVKSSGKDLEGGDIKVRFYYCLQKIFKGLQDEKQITDAEKLRMAKFTDVLIKSKEIAEYE